MFENFVYFKEVTKLSTIIYYDLRRINYSDSLLKIICNKETENGVDVLEEVEDLIEDKSQIKKVFELFDNIPVEASSRLLDCIFKIITSGNNEADKNICDGLLYYSMKCGHLDLASRVIDYDNENNIEDSALSLAAKLDNTEIIKYLFKNRSYERSELIKAVYVSVRNCIEAAKLIISAIIYLDSGK